MIRVYFSQNAVESKYVFVVKVSDIFSEDHVIGKHEMGLTSQVVNIGADRIVAAWH